MFRIQFGFVDMRAFGMRGTRSSSPIVRRPNLRGSLVRGRQGDDEASSASATAALTSSAQQYLLTPELGKSPGTPSPPSDSAGEHNTLVGTTEMMMSRTELIEDAARKNIASTS